MKKCKTRKMNVCDGTWLTAAPEDFFDLWLETLPFHDQLSSHPSSVLLIWTIIKVPLWSQQGLWPGHAKLTDLLLGVYCVIKGLMVMTGSTWALQTASQLEKDNFLCAKVKTSHDLHLAANKQDKFQSSSVNTCGFFKILTGLQWLVKLWFSSFQIPFQNCIL